MFYQLQLRFNHLNRYTAHVEIDRLFGGLDRTERNWRHVIAVDDIGQCWALLRSNDPAVVATLKSPFGWSTVRTYQTGEEVDFILQYAPKHKRALLTFRNDDAIAIDHLRRHAGGLQDIEIELLGRHLVSVEQKGIFVPSCIARIRGTVVDPDAVTDLQLAGVGGLRAFGIGIAVDRSTRFYELLESIAMLPPRDHRFSHNTIPLHQSAAA